MYQLAQVEYAKGLNAIALSDNTSQPNKALSASEITTLRGGIGSVLFLCLTRWDLLYDLVVLQTKVKDAVREQLIECNRIIMAAKRHVDRGLIFERLSSGHEPTYDRRRRLAAVADSCHASAKSSYAFEGNLVFLQPECDAKAQSTKD